MQKIIQKIIGLVTVALTMLFYCGIIYSAASQDASGDRLAETQATQKNKIFSLQYLAARVAFKDFVLSEKLICCEQLTSVAQEALAEQSIIYHGHDAQQALRFAVRDDNRFLFTIRFLKKWGMNIDKFDQNGTTILWREALKGNEAVVACLAAAGADVNRANTNNVNPLWRASSDGRSRMVRALIAAGADVNFVGGHYNMTSLGVAAAEGQLDVVKILVGVRADLNQPDVGGHTPIFYAVLKEHESVVACLAAAGADVNRVNIHNISPLWRASRDGNSSMVRALIAGGADINFVGGFYCKTPIQIAASEGRLDIVQILVEARADCNKVDGDGATPLAKAIGNRCNDVAQYLRDHGAL